jgi:CheY-like chemotaxis protein
MGRAVAPSARQPPAPARHTGVTGSLVAALDLSRKTRINEFEALMSHRVENIILVSSLYDKFILQEDGQLNEVILGEFLDLHLHHTTGLTHVSTGSEALALAQADPRYSLIITALNVGDMNAVKLARRVKEVGLEIPVVVLAYDGGELSHFLARHDTSGLYQVFLWQGDVRILLAIIKYVEDRLNVDHDTGQIGVQVILLVEDNVRYYSSFLPMIFSEVIRHSQAVIPEGMNVAHKILRMRARPKILLCTNFEEAWDYFTAYQEEVLGVISDIQFPREGRLDPEAGVVFARRVKEAWPDIPIVLQSSRPDNEARARSVGATFLRKGSPTLLHDLRTLMSEQFSFGDFVFRLPGGTEIDRAGDLRTLLEKLPSVPIRSIIYHAERNHFSRWLKARTEFRLAQKVRPRRTEDFRSPEDVRADLITAVEEYRREQGRLHIADFDRESFDSASSFSRIGGGSLGGKARALAFARHLLNTSGLEERFRDVQVSVPPSVVLATDVFDEFLERNGLRDLAIMSDDDDEIEERFLAASLPPGVCRDLSSFLQLIRYPLAVRSSSLLEDSQYQPLAGVYDTFMLPNNHPDLRFRLRQLQSTIKRVYASTFSRRAKSYLGATPYRLEEEKMAVIIQKLVGAAHSERFYPDFSGVARSYNYYPSPPSTAEDGIATVALGLGLTVVRGEKSQSFSPRHPRNLMNAAVEDALRTSQSEFYALEPSLREKRYALCVAEQDGTLAALASTYAPEDDAIHDGTGRPGIPLITFAPILKFDLFPLADILSSLLELGKEGMGTAVEIEFAVTLAVPPGELREFGFLQMRPMGVSHDLEELEIGDLSKESILASSESILGNGELDDIHDLVVVDPERFDRSHSHEAVRELAHLNAALTRAGRPYILFGVGRWGSADPWLGIPVKWEEISGARVIVEHELLDVAVTPSQGSHFFQNLTSFGIGYFTVNPEAGEGSVDWSWLAAQPAAWEGAYSRHLRLGRPVTVLMNGKRRQGVILKP